jgi:menaquinone-dependent protoporphyrinogen IX oxidase
MLIIYTSKHGYTLQLAERMFNFGNGRNKLFNISSADDFQMENEEKLCILFPIYYGAPMGEVIEFLKKNSDFLESRKVILGVVGCNPDIFSGIKYFLKIENSDKELVREKLFGKLERDYFDRFNVILIRGVVKMDELSEFEKKFNPNYKDVINENEFEYEMLYEQLNTI